MTPHDLLKHLDVIAEAPNGIARLRELVLQLAVRGKLVPQDPDEAPASARPSALEEGDQPFPIPETWWWGPLPEVAEYSVGKTPPTKEPRFWGDGDIPWVSIADMTHGETIRATSRTVTKAAAAEVFRKPPAAAGSILMSFKLTIGKTGLLGMPAYHNEAIISVSPRPVVSRDFLFRVLPVMAVFGDSKAAIKGATLNGQSLARIPVPVPPVPEQDRIVARIDELMALLDRLEAARSTREATRRALRDSSLAALRDADTPDDLESAWQRVAAHMDDLLATPEDLPPFRQTILQLAVRGRLVRQDPTDEPASALLERIGREKAKLLKSGQVRSSGPLAPVSTDETPFELPWGWKWSRCHDVFASVTDGDHQPPPRAESGVPFLVIGNVSNGHIDFSDTRHVPVEYYDGLDWSKRPAAGDVLYTVTGSFGISLLVDTPRPFCVQRHIGILKSVSCVNSRYLCLALASPPAVDYARQRATGIAQKTVSLAVLRQLPIPLPPLAEQDRIVTRVDALMRVLASLEQRVERRESASDAVAVAVVVHLEAEPSLDAAPTW